LSRAWYCDYYYCKEPTCLPHIKAVFRPTRWILY